MIFTHDNASELSVHPAIVCVGNTPVKTVKTSTKVLFDNNQVENALVAAYNSHTYEENDFSMGDKSMPVTSAENGYYYTIITTNPVSLTSDDGKKFLTNCQDSYIYVRDATNSNRHTTNYGYIPEVAYRNMYIDYWARFDEQSKPVAISTPQGTMIEFYFDNSSNATKQYETEVQGKVTLVYNLIPGRKYYYKVKTGSTVKATGWIKTDGQIRMIHTNSLGNIRDCGGWKTTDNNYRFKYGLLYRGIELDKKVWYYQRKSDNAYVTNEYIESLNLDDATIATIYTNLDAYKIAQRISQEDLTEFKRLNIGTELDLRSTQEGTFTTQGATSAYRINYSFSSNDQAHGYYINASSSASYGSLIGNNKSTTHQGAKDFLYFVHSLEETVRKGHAVYIHCQQGRDRTGSFCETLLGLLGVSTDGFIKDYELTSLYLNPTTRYILAYRDFDKELENGVWTKVTKKSLSNYRTYLNKWTGSSIQEKLEAWFKAIYKANLSSSTSSNSYKYHISDSNGNRITDEAVALIRLKDLLLEKVPMSEKTIGIIGDSNSAYHTWKPTTEVPYFGEDEDYYEEDSCYYGEFPCREDTGRTGTNDNVKSPEDMWWYKTAAYFGMNPESQVSLAAWSGTAVSDLAYVAEKAQQDNVSITREKTSNTFKNDARCASSPARIKHLSSKFEGKAPDIVICFIGSNDIKYLNRSYNNNSSSYTFDETELEAYYKTMLDNIKAAYPKAKIFCTSTVYRSADQANNSSSFTSFLSTLAGSSNYENVSFIDISSAYKGSASNYNQVGNCLISDNTHPNQTGHTRIADKIKTGINNWYNTIPNSFS